MQHFGIVFLKMQEAQGEGYLKNGVKVETADDFQSPECIQSDSEFKTPTFLSFCILHFKYKSLLCV